MPVDINECDSSPCENGGSCEDEVDDYTCHCLAGYSGDHCQTGKITLSFFFVVFSFIQHSINSLLKIYVVLPHKPHLTDQSMN